VGELRMSLETYVKIVGKERTEDWPDTYCPIDIDETGKVKQITIGLSLIGFVPEGAQIVGEYDEDTDKLTLYEKPTTLEGRI
jgi:hypothetical protein